jgi:hypothetical protein
MLVDFISRKVRNIFNSIKSLADKVDKVDGALPSRTGDQESIKIRNSQGRREAAKSEKGKLVDTIRWLSGETRTTKDDANSPSSQFLFQASI